MYVSLTCFDGFNGCRGPVCGGRPAVAVRPSVPLEGTTAVDLPCKSSSEYTTDGTSVLVEGGRCVLTIY
jgi:hypothetical protein